MARQANPLLRAAELLGANARHHAAMREGADAPLSGPGAPNGPQKPPIPSPRPTRRKSTRGKAKP